MAFEEEEKAVTTNMGFSLLYRLMSSSLIFSYFAFYELLRKVNWVNTEWKQVEADWQELQSIPNF